MAKHSILGVIRGKVGNMVGQSNSLSNGKDKQVWRAYNGTVANPKTMKQAMQRSLFVAAKNFQTAFEGILNHSWQGVDYGPKSLNFFRQQVLTAGGANYPTFAYQQKGSMTPIPQPWPVSKGSINVQGIRNILFAEGKFFELNGGEEYDLEAATLAGAMPGLQVGDQITLVALKAPWAIADGGVPMTPTNIISANYIPVVGRFIVDDTAVGSTLTRFAFTDEAGVSVGYALSVTVDGIVSVCTDTDTAASIDLAAFALIVSRKVEGKASWQRSTAVMFVPDFISEALNGAAHVQYVLRSFMEAAGNQESDWYLNESTDDTTTENPGYIAARTVQTSGEVPVTLADAAITTRDFGSFEGSTILWENRRQYYKFTAPNVLTLSAQVADSAYDDGVTGFNEVILNSALRTELTRLGYVFA